MIKKLLKLLLCISMVVTLFSTLNDNVYADDVNLIKVTVLYQYKDGTEAYESDISTVVKGESHSLDIIFPKIPGYKPMLKVGDNYEDCLKLSIDTITLSEDTTYTVCYFPIDVQYQIRYYKQNVTDDQYSEDANLYVIGQGKTGEEPPATLFNKEITGFTKLYHDPDEIAADGSTIFEIYYDRNYYMIYFDLDGGYGTVPVYERYGTSVTVTEPTKPGYDFVEWQLVESSVVVDPKASQTEHDECYNDITKNHKTSLPSTVPYANMTYKAIWKEKEISDDYNNQYTVVYWKWNPNPVIDGEGNSVHRYDYWGSYVVDKVKAGTEVTNVRSLDDLKLSQYKYYEKTPVEIKGLGKIKGDGTSVINVYYKPQQYTFKFFYVRTPLDDDDGYEVGGNTTQFASDHSTNYSVNDGKTRLEMMLTNDAVHWGSVKEKPIVEDDNGYYTFGVDEIGDYNYDYFTFKAYFGEKIGYKWPVGIIDPVGQNDGRDNWGTDATFSAWNSEFYSKYARRSNKTVKGRYSFVDEEILYDTEYTGTGESDLSVFYHNNTVHFLGFYENAVTTVDWNRSIEIHYYMYIPDDAGDHTFKDRQYRLYDDVIIYDNNGTGSVLTEQTPTAIEGYKFVKDNDHYRTFDVETSGGNQTKYSVAFYYEPLSYNLQLNNNGKIVDVQGTFEYDESLSFFATPTYPDNLEPGVYEFKGWYENPEFSEYSKVGDDYTMPAHDVMLYAKWEKTKLNVTVFEDIEDYNNNENGVFIEDAFYHGSGVGKDIIPTPTKEGYTFVGWYFYDPITGIKKRFEYDILPFYHDLRIFAEWTSPNVIPYVIKYMLKDTVTEIGEPTTGKTNAGLTKTFYAKNGEQLKENYKQGYYPETNSHSLLMKHYNGNGVNPNTYEFLYVAKSSVKYKIQYIDETTGDVLKTITPNPTNKTAVTEKFVQPVDGKTYIPDSMYKTLILSANETQNIIKFYCKEVVNQAKYIVRHYIEKEVVDGQIQYEEYKIDEFVDTIGVSVEAKPIDIVGYTYVSEHANEKKTGTVDKTGLELSLYYNKNTYPYEIRHVLEGTNTPLEADGKPSTEKYYAKYGDVLTLHANEYSDYQPVTETQNVEIRVSGEDPITNVVIFYYHSKQATVKYVVVTDDGGVGGWLSNNQITLDATNVDSNPGSTANANTYYTFAGWYSDFACTNKIEASIANKYELSRDGKTLAPRVIEDATYYARFVRPPGPIQITHLNPEDETQVFVYTVTWSDPDGKVNTITVTTKGSETVKISGLPFGEYTVTEESSWSWRHDKVTIVKSHNSADTRFDFTNPQKSDKYKWLNGNSAIKHNVREVTQ